jgi:hypothetical protein
MFDYSLMEYWEPKVTQKEFSALLNLEGSPTVPDQLMRLCDCAVFPDWSKRSVKVGANDRETLDLIFKKLQRVEDFFRSGFSPLVANLVNAEDKPKFQLRLVSLAKQNIVERTTLFDTHSKWNTYSTDRLYTVRLMEYDPVTHKYKSCKLDSGLVHTAYKTTSHKDWDSYVFCTREPSSPSAALASSDGVPESPHVDRHIDPEDLICVYHAPVDSIATSEAASSADVGELPGSIRVEQAKRHPRVKPSRDASSASLPSGSVSSPSPSPAPLPPMGARGGIASSSSGYDTSESSNNNTAHRGYPIRQPPRPFVDAELEHGPRPVASSDGTSTVSGGIPLGSEPDLGLTLGTRPADTGIALGARPADAELEGPAPVTGATRRPRERKPAPARASSPKANGPKPLEATESPLGSELDRPFGLDLGARPTDTGIALGARPADAELEGPAPVTGATRRPRERKPAPARAPPPNANGPKPLESAESSPEPTTRRVMRTVNQKKPKSPASTNAGNEAKALRRHNVQRVFETIFPALEYTRGWCGELKLEAKIGRLIFLDIDRAIARKELEWRQWDKLMADIEPKTTFTRILTGHHWDMEFLRDLKLPGGENIFSPEPVSRRVTYDFDIEQKGKKFVLSIDGETFKPALYANKKTFAAVNMANPVHSWDYRIELVGKKPLDLKSYPFVKAIHDSLTVGHGPDLTFIVEGPALFVKRVLLKCETRHTVYLETLRMGAPMELVMAEVQELEMRKSNEAVGKYRAFALPRSILESQARLHWVASVVPTHANALLKQNTQLEVGETTQWTTDEILGTNLLPGLQGVMNMIVAKIDYVGSSNQAFV